MPESAAAIPEVPPLQNENQNQPVTQLTHVGSNHKRVVEKIRDHLKQTGNQAITSEEISADGEANATLANIENSNIGAEIAGGALDLATQGMKNARGDIIGSQRTYSTEGGKGHKIVFRRIKDRVFRTKIAEKVHNFLARKR